MLWWLFQIAVFIWVVGTLNSDPANKGMGVATSFIGIIAAFAATLVVSKILALARLLARKPWRHRAEQERLR